MNVLVCGGGWVGVNAASRLARSGCRVTLLEKRDCLLSETSSRSTECFRLAWADATMRSFVGDSIELLEQDARKHGVSLSKPGYLFVSTDERKQLELAASFGRVREHRGNLSAYPKDAFEGVDVLFGSELINEAFPGRIANARQMVGVHMRRGGWLDTATLASRLANDFECKTNSEVEEILWSGSRARGVKLRSGQILEADAVVLSMGPSFSGFVKRAGFLQDVPMVNEIHAHCLFDNCSLPQAIPLTFFGEVSWFFACLKEKTSPDSLLVRCLGHMLRREQLKT